MILDEETLAYAKVENLMRLAHAMGVPIPRGAKDKVQALLVNRIAARNEALSRADARRFRKEREGWAGGAERRRQMAHQTLPSVQRP